MSNLITYKAGYSTLSSTEAWEDAVEVEIIQREGKKPVTASEFISGYKGKNIYFY